MVGYDDFTKGADMGRVVASGSYELLRIKGCHALCPKCGKIVEGHDDGYKCRKCRKVWPVKYIRDGLFKPELTNAQRRHIIKGNRGWL